MLDFKASLIEMEESQRIKEVKDELIEKITDTLGNVSTEFEVRVRDIANGTGSISLVRPASNDPQHLNWGDIPLIIFYARGARWAIMPLTSSASDRDAVVYNAVMPVIERIIPPSYRQS